MVLHEPWTKVIVLSLNKVTPTPPIRLAVGPPKPNAHIFQQEVADVPATASGSRLRHLPGLEPLSGPGL